MDIKLVAIASDTKRELLKMSDKYVSPTGDDVRVRGRTIEVVVDGGFFAALFAREDAQAFGGECGRRFDATGEHAPLTRLPPNPAQVAVQRAQIDLSLTQTKLVFVFGGGLDSVDDIEESLCAELFNTMGMLFEVLKNKEAGK